MSWFVETLKNTKYFDETNIPKIFVETGSYIGEGIQRYLQEPQFKQIYSIDLSEKWYNYCKEKFLNEERVTLYHGNSSDVINILIDNIDEPVLWYLDAHFSGGETAGEHVENGCPVIKELDVIAQRNNPGDVIFIDDMRLMGKASFSGIENDSVYPLTFFDFRHASVENIISVFNNHNIEIMTMFCQDIDRMVIVNKKFNCIS